MVVADQNVLTLFTWLLKAYELRADVVPLAWVVCPLQYQGTAETSPPSTCKETPVMYEAAGESKKAAALPSSAGSPYLPKGIPWLTFWRCSSVEMPNSVARASSRERDLSVSIRPGAMLFTRTRGPSSFARHLTSAATPGRNTLEESRFFIGSRTEVEVMKSTEAPSFNGGTGVRSSRTGPPIRRRKASSHCSSASSSAGPKGGPPALISTPSSEAKRSTATR